MWKSEFSLTADKENVWNYAKKKASFSLLFI